MKIVLLLGAPGSGKGTFGKLMSQKEKKWKHFSIGEMFRNEVYLRSKMGQHISPYLNSGKLVPDNVADNFVVEKISQLSHEKSTEILLLDGYPRTLSQCQYLQEYSRRNNIASTKAILIDIPEWIIVKKLLGRRICSKCQGDFNICDIRQDDYDMPPILPNPNHCHFGTDACEPILISRSDDTREIIEQRLNTYNQKIMSIIDFYRTNKLFYSFTVAKGVADTDKLIKLISNIAYTK